MPKTLKTLEYRQANWLDDKQNLEQLIRKAWAEFETQSDRTISRSNNRLITGLQSRDFGDGGFAIHCARYTNGQGIGTVPMEPQTAAEIGERLPNDNENFMNADFMALIKNNHLIAMNCGRNAGALRDFLIKLFVKANFEKSAEMLELARIGNLNKLAMIQAVGVKTIKMNVDISETSATAINDEKSTGTWANTKRGISTLIASITEKDQKIERLRSAEKGRVTVSINVNQGDLDLAKSGLNSFAEAIADDECAEDFVIRLRNGQDIRSEEVTVRKQVRLQEAANSVSVDETWNAMTNYYTELSESGQIGV